MMPTQKIRKTAFWLGLALPAFALLATIWVTHVTNGQFNAAFASVTQTYNILNILEQAQAHAADAETGRRGYLLTGREDYFSLHDTAMAAINNDIQNLKILVKGNPAQETNLAELQIIIAQRLGAGANGFAPGNARLAGASAVALTDEGLAIMSRIRDVLFHLRQQQTDLLASRQKTAEAKFLFDQTVSLVLVAVTSITLIFIITIVMRLEHLRQIVTICAWTGQVQFEGQWISLEDYLRKRFGVSVSHGVSQEAADEMLREMRRPSPASAPPAK